MDWVVAPSEIETDTICWIVICLSKPPVEILPSWLRAVSQFLPTTYAIAALRKVLILGAPIASISSELSVLAAFTLFTIPIGMIVFRAGYNAARVRGSLLEY